MSLRWKLALAMASIASVATIALGVAHLRTTRSQLYREVDRSLVAVDLRIGDRPLPQAIPDRGPLSGFEAQYVDADGNVVRSTFDIALPVDEELLGLVGPGGRSRLSDVTIGDDHFRVRTVGAPRGLLQIARSLDETDRVLSALWVRTMLWTLVAVGLSSIAGWWIASRATASLRRLTVAAEHVEETGRLDVSVGDDGVAATDEVGRLAAAFDRMFVALRRSREDQQRLVENAGHELRTPLTSLRTNLDALERYPSMSSGDRAAILADLRVETHELTDLVNEIVAVASGEQSDERFESVDLRDLADRVATRFTRRTGRQVEVSGLLAAPVVGQAASLQRAISCLVDNACKFDQGDGPIVVEVDASGVVVVDRGPGIDPDEAELVFERFHRAPAARTMPGSGLGLSMVRDIARRHSGDAFAANAPSGGARVGFRVGGFPPPGS